MEISERDLRRLVREVDDEHHDGMRTMAADVAEMHHGEGRQLRNPTRRSFLGRAMGTGATLTIGSAVLPFGRLAASYGQDAEELTDADIAAFAESIELAAVEAYAAAAKSGLITEPAIAQAGATFAGHHKEHAAAFAAASDDKAKGKANPTLLRAIGDQLGTAADQAGVVKIAFDLENGAASTYLFAIGAFKDAKAVQLAASILPVEAQHAVVLGQVLGRPLTGLFPPHPDPTKLGDPNAFETKDQALDPSSHPVPKS